MSEPITVPHAASLLIRLRLRRALNLFDAIYRYRFRGAGRKATARTSPTMVLISGLVVLVMLGSFTHLAYQCMTNIQDVLGTVRSAMPRLARFIHGYWLAGYSSAANMTLSPLCHGNPSAMMPIPCGVFGTK